MGLTLEQIRQQLNIPKSTSDAEVIRIANANNIVIDFTGLKSSDNLPVSDNFNNPSGSVWTAGGQNTAPQNSQGGVFGGMGLSLSNTGTIATKGASELSVARVATSDVIAVDKKSGAHERRREPILKDDIDHFTSENGITTIYKKDGTVIKRHARRGEAGYIKRGSGESFDERIKRFYGMSDEQLANLSETEKREKIRGYISWVRSKGKNLAVDDFNKLVINSGMSPEQAKNLGAAVYGLSDKDMEPTIKRITSESLYKDEVQSFTEGVVDNIDLAENSETQASIIASVAEAGKTAGISEEVSTAIGNAVTSNKFHGKEATLEALRTQYGLSAEQANEYYKNLPEEVRQKIEDETLGAISTVQTEVAADETQPEDVRHDAADLSTEYITYIDDAEYQMQVIQANSDYMMQNADEEMQQYYNNSIANNAYNYDISNREDIIRMVKELGTEKTLEILDNARKEYEAQDADNKAASEYLKEVNSQKTQQEQVQTQTQAQSQQSQQTQQQPKIYRATIQHISTESPKSFVERLARPSSFSGLTPVQTYVMSEEFKSADMHTKQSYINKLSVSDRKQAVAALVETATPAQLTAYMYSGLKKNILSYLVNNPNGKNTETLKYLAGFLSGPDKQFVKQLEEERNKLLGLKHTPNNVDFTQQRRNPFNIEA